MPPSGWPATPRYEIDVQDGNVDALLSDFPLGVFFDNDANLVSALATGYDIRFTLDDGTTLLTYERESWTGGGGANATALFWVSVPSIAAVGGATIHCYWNKAGAPDVSGNPWDANFVGVYHLKDDPDSSTVKDSSASGYDGTKKGAGEPVQVTGKVKYGQEFDGTADNGGDDYIATGATPSMNFYQHDLALEVWVYLHTKRNTTKQENEIWTRRNASDAGIAWHIGDYQVSNAKVALSTDDGVWHGHWATTEMALNAWHHIAVSVDWDGNASFYLDGAPDGASAYTDPSNLASASYTTIGALKAAGGCVFDGPLDELRISDSQRSAAWWKFQFANITEADHELTMTLVSGHVPHFLLLRGAA